MSTIKCEIIDEETNEVHIAHIQILDNEEEFSENQCNISETTNNISKHDEDLEKEEQPSTSKKSLKKKGKAPNQYIKKRLLKEMMKEGSNCDTFKKITRNFKTPISEIKEKLNVSVKEAQDYVYQECESLSFQNMTAWLEYFKKIKAHQHCSHESSIVINAIANNEKHAKPQELDGVDLKAIYNFLSNAFLGLPQPPLNDSSRAFLVREFENIINEANTESGDFDTFNIREDLLQTHNPLSSLNPLNITTNLGDI